MTKPRTLKITSKFLTISIMSFIYLLTASSFAATQSLPHPPLDQKVPLTRTVIVSTGEWSPIISKQKLGYGPLSMVISEAFALSGIKVEFQFFPWKRAMQELRSGRTMASSAWRKTSDREQEFLFSDGVYDNQNVFFHLKSTPFDWNTLSDLKNYYIGAALGYAYSEDFEKGEERGDFEVFRVNKEKSLIEMLLTKRIDVFPANREVGLQLIRTQTPEAFAQFAIHPKPISLKPLHLVFNKDPNSKAMLNKFNLGLRQLKQSGRYAEIYDMRSEK